MGLRETIKTLWRGGKPIKSDTDFLPELESASLQDIINLLISLRESSSNTSEKLRDYLRMADDGVVGGAIQLMADDATQIDFNSQESLWVESNPDSLKGVECAKYLNTLIKDRHLDQLLWSIAYNVIRDGGCFVCTHEAELTDMGEDRKSAKIRNKRGYIFDIVPNYGSVAELLHYGDSVGFYRDQEKKSIVYGNKEFIHFCNDRRGIQETVKLKLRQLDSDGQEKENEFQIRRGLSFLESARSAFRVLEIMELVLIAVRLGRSQLYRLVQVEVGNADKNETAKLLREFKTKLATQESIDPANGSYAASLKPIPHGQNVYIPTRNGKGAVTINTVGGDYQLREILDIEYFKGKLHAALQIPKAYLGAEESLPGGIGDTSLTRMDIRYARRVRRLKTILQTGFQDIFDYHLRVVGKPDWIGTYKVKTAQIITAEENDRYEAFKARMEFTDALGQLFSDIPGFSRRKFARLVSNKILQLGDVYAECVDETAPDTGDEGEEGDSFEPTGVTSDIDTVEDNYEPPPETGGGEGAAQ